MSACAATHVPGSQGKTLDFNEHLMEWGEINGINIIKTASTFMLTTGEVDDICFDMENHSYPVLNRLSVIKLLCIIKKQHPDIYLCTDWEESKKNINTHKAHRNGKRYLGRDNPTLDIRAPVENADPLRPPSHARHAASRVNNVNNNVN